MTFVQWVVNGLNTIAMWFYAIYLEVNGWVFPFNLAAPFFRDVTMSFMDLSSDFYNFGVWVSNIYDMAVAAITEIDVWNFLAIPIQWANIAWTWVVNAWTNIWNEVDTWWNTTKPVVLGWIDSARLTLEGLIDAVKLEVNTISTAWNNFTTSILPNLADWTGIQALINSTLITWFPFYDDLIDIFSEITEFFSNPLDWLINKLEDWFWGEE